MKRKSPRRLFDDEMNYTKEALDIDSRASNLIEGLVKECNDQGICFRDLSYVLQSSINCLLLVEHIAGRENLKLKEKNENSIKVS